MSDGVQLMLWECNGNDQQTWGYDSDYSKVYISNTATCLDFWEDQQYNGQWVHTWGCNELSSQEWTLWDTSAPSGPLPSPPGPTPAPPSPTPAVNYFNSCDDTSGGNWPTFPDQSSLLQDSKW